MRYPVANSPDSSRRPCLPLAGALTLRHYSRLSQYVRYCHFHHSSVVTEAWSQIGRRSQRYHFVQSRLATRESKLSGIDNSQFDDCLLACCQQKSTTMTLALTFRWQSRSSILPELQLLLRLTSLRRCILHCLPQAHASMHAAS